MNVKSLISMLVEFSITHQSSRILLKLTIFLAALWSSACTAPALPELVLSEYFQDYRLDEESQDPFEIPYTDTPGVQHTYYLFEPTPKLGVPALTEAPVIVYFHGGFGPLMTPHPVRHQIRHYVASGYTVVWLRFCDNCTLDIATWDTAAKQAIADALTRLNSTGHVSPSTDATGVQMSFVAHSVGAHVAARVASALGSEDSNTAPRSVINYDPAGFDFVGTILSLNSTDLSGFRPDTLLVILASDQFDGPGSSNTYKTAQRLYWNSGISDRLALVLPHICATATSFDCPPALTQSIHDRSANYYFSSHNASIQEVGETDAAFDADLAFIHNGYYDHAVACLNQVHFGLANAACNGIWAGTNGRWKLNNGSFVPAALKHPYEIEPPR